MKPVNTDKYYASLAIQTRKYGHCYVHAGMRADWTGDNGILYRVTGYGRSLETRRGHKYKVHAVGYHAKPVSSKVLAAI
ncbi:hypothetical protein UFOVP296_12 [uncultured Caudovirales phage]|uniref:Uncharacterized protein n=1 Tax=uncultured Caudovirales phage TaxID=2100421 RepID=A0A6J5PFW7_9CAUD|nr:hypothetical protein UFOVP296_12 [uncultured Caudovirales phage]CAB4170042.1 hypothetical protein UFOVP912_31 [uncultured Caudovirales phage]CAB4199165.1 hypothetical protein UFOVP1334_19 [uncultured Caudovirales phage]